MIVVDTNLIIYLFFTGEHTTQVEKAFRKDPEWVAPLLWRSEFRNVLAYYLRKGVISLHQVYLIMEKALQMMMGREFDVISYHVLNLVNTSECTAYDCEFIALAQDLKVPMVTLDQQILSQFPGTALSLDEYIAE